MLTKTKYKPYVYIFENMEFRNRFKGYRLCKIGYSQSPKDRLRQMPASDVCKIIYMVEGGRESELLLMESFRKENNIILFPYYGYYDRVKVKETTPAEMYDYLNCIRYGMRKSWGYSEWFIVKFL